MIRDRGIEWMAGKSGGARVVITGIGLRTGLGEGRESTWAAMRAGRSAARILDRVPAPAGESPYVAYQLLDHEICARDHLDLAAREALFDARVVPEDGAALDRDRIGTVIGYSKGNLRSWRIQHGEPSRLMSAPWDLTWPNALASFASRAWDFRGPSLAPIAACATGVIALIQGAELIMRGLCDIVLVGALDSSLEPLVLGAFRKMRAFANPEADPTRALRPWNRDRSGFLPGEGGALLVLEREDHARSRGVLPYAEFCGGAFGSDAYHLTDLDPDPAGLSHVIGLAQRQGKVSPNDLDHINVHGTATRQNDPLECRAIRKVLGPRAYDVSCSANKAQIGHLLGAAGAAELAITCLAIRDGFVPPTLNLDDPDPECDLDGTPHVGKAREIRAALKISIGFGGHLAAAVLRRPDGPSRAPVPLPSGPVLP